MKYKTLKSYTDAVNKLSRKDCDKIKPSSIFGYYHHDFPESMMKYYFEQGLTPRQAIDSINREARLEAAWEARVS